ncbi:MAG: phage tail sheath family protein [Cyanobacteriota bacterium]|jgi:phage tail sheath protein FI
MPEYLAPGVFIEETSYRAKSIEGVSTTTTGFVGASRYGPIDLDPELITSIVEFEQTFGGRLPLDWGGGPVDNHLWNAVRGFFEEGGKRLYVARAFKPSGSDATDFTRDCARVIDPRPAANVTMRARFPGKAGEARVRLTFISGQNRFTMEEGVARVRGARHRDVVRVTGFVVGGNDRSGLYLLTYAPLTNTWTFTGSTDGAPGTTTSFDMQALAGASAKVHVRLITATVTVDQASRELPSYVAADLALDPLHEQNGALDSLFAHFAVEPPSQARARTIPIVISAMTVAEAFAASAAADKKKADALTPLNQAITAVATATTKRDDAQDELDEAVNKSQQDEAAAVVAEANAPNDPNTVTLRSTADASALAVAERQDDLDAAQMELDNAIQVRDLADAAHIAASDEATAAGLAYSAAVANGGTIDGLAFLNGYLATVNSTNRFTRTQLDEDPPNPALTTATFFLQNGGDGLPPDAAAFAGTQLLSNNRTTGLVQFENIEDISIVAAPGSTRRDMTAGEPQAIANALISHARKMRYRIAVLDSVEGHSLSEVRAYRGLFDSSHAALYYPWVRIIDPHTGQENLYPPSGFVAGIYARNDLQRAVYKAPANEVVGLALGFEKRLNTAQQEVLNPEGINCFRFFEGRGMRLWGARTISSDPEWKYVNLRRYFAYVERSIEKGTQWAVFEPNGPRLWANVRRTIEDFLLNEWQNGALLGDRPEMAYFVKCDRSTMSQNDLDNGRLVCQIGLAPLRPAEFVIFRIGQWTADRKI